MGGKAARLESRQGRLLCREFYPVTAREDAAAGNFIQHEQREEDAATILAAVLPPAAAGTGAGGAGAEPGGETGPLQPHPGCCPPLPPRREELPVPRPPCGVGGAAGRGRGGGTGGCGRFLPPPPSGQSGAGRELGSARPSRAPLPGRAKLPEGLGHIRARTHI